MLSTAITDTDLKKELAPAVKQASKDRAIAKKKNKNKLSPTPLTIKKITIAENCQSWEDDLWQKEKLFCDSS